MPTTPLLFFILCIFTSGPLWAGESEDWALAKEVDGITLYTRTADDVPVKAVKAVMMVDGTPGVAAALIMDAAATPEWIYGVESTEIIKSDGPDDVWVRNVIAMPWPLADRDNVNQMKLVRQTQDGTLVVEMISQPGARPVEEGVMRMPVAEGRWLLKPTDPKRVEITYEYMADPGGKIPDWVLDLFLLEGPIATFREMREMLLKPEYRSAPLAIAGD